MKLVEPKVYLIGMTQVNREALMAYLTDLGVPEWKSDAASDGEFLVEVMGRLCYASFGVGLNPNITRVREGNALYVENLLKQLHGSVFEHVQLNFIFHDVSRVFTHELVRHRVGTAISQESLRYVRLDKIDMWLPPVLANDLEVVQRSMRLVEHMEQHQLWLAEHYGLDDEGVNFHFKKQVTSAMRRFAPIGLATEIGWSSNIRNLRHVIENRTAPGAEDEIRYVFGLVAEIVKKEYPVFFGDFEAQFGEGDYPSYVPKYRKV